MLAAGLGILFVAIGLLGWIAWLIDRIDLEIAARQRRLRRRRRQHGG